MISGSSVARWGVVVAIASAGARARLAPTATGSDTVRAELNDQRTPAGHIADGERRLALEAVEAEWRPRGADGPHLIVPVFAEAGHAPQVPGPLLRLTVGVPVRVRVHNTLPESIVVRGLVDRVPKPAPPNVSRARAASQSPDRLPAFVHGDSLVVPPGETLETRFTPSAPVSSFYFARIVLPRSASPAPRFIPSGRIFEGSFMGALIVDPAGSHAASVERVLMITRWGSPQDPAINSFKIMLNGASWPYTERLVYSVNDTVRWRVINASGVAHPMHLHGFYFTVNVAGDGQSDITVPPPDRRLSVTEVMPDFSAMRLTWVAERPGNWLFHCHLVRHMDEEQRFNSERAARPQSDDHDGHDMAGLVLGITIRPRASEPLEPKAGRRIDLWTGQRPNVYDGKPQYGFVVQQDAVPSADSTRVPGSTLVLHRGEPTDIVVHNRLEFPLAVHWHGVELRSLYDGVGNWSGTPGATRAPIAPHDSMRIRITPRRAGTFMYHTHGEAGTELAQGLYGPIVVLEPNEQFRPETDRLFMLAAHGARLNAPPALNGVSQPEPEQFEPGRTYRLRFLEISPDELKRVRLLHGNDAVTWTPLAKDGADLPPAARVSTPAEVDMGVGETYDFAWKPDVPGIYLLDVVTRFYPAIGGTAHQRLAFAVGPVPRAELMVAQSGTDLPLVELSAAERGRYVGTFVGRGVSGDTTEHILGVYEDREQLYGLMAIRHGTSVGTPDYLASLGGNAFALGGLRDGLVTITEPRKRLRFGRSDGVATSVEIAEEGTVAMRLARVDTLELSAAERERLVGTYTITSVGAPFTVTLQGTQLISSSGGRTERLIPITNTIFRPAGLPGLRVEFSIDGGRAVAVTIVQPNGQRIRAPRNP